MLVRALIVLLSVLNLGVAAWWIAHDPPPPAAPAQVPAGVTRLKLVGEEAGTPAPVPAAPAPMEEQVAAPPTSGDDLAAASVQRCFSFGPFAPEQAGATAADRLRPLVQKLTVREQPASAAAARGWRVYLPPLPSLEQAQAVAERIGAAGFDDYLVVREGVEANSIALGRYRSEEAANRRSQALIAAGFAVQTEPLGQPAGAATMVWLDVVADEAFDPRRAQAAIGATQYRRAACPAR